MTSHTGQNPSHSLGNFFKFSSEQKILLLTVKFHGFFSIRSDRITLNSHISPRVYKAEVSGCSMIGIVHTTGIHIKDC